MMLSTRASRSPWVLASLMTLAMGMPMMVFYAIGVLGPQIIQDLGISREQLGWLTTSTFGLAALLSPWAGALVQRMGNRHGLFLLFLLVAMSFSLIAVLPGFWGVLTALLLCGLAQSLANPVTNQAIAQLVPAERKAGLVGIKQSGVQASALLAGLVLPTGLQTGVAGGVCGVGTCHAVPVLLCPAAFASQSQHRSRQHVLALALAQPTTLAVNGHSAVRGSGAVVLHHFSGRICAATGRVAVLDRDAGQWLWGNGDCVPSALDAHCCPLWG
nr:MFS transporter [Alcaligenes sp. HPC1271]